tara:strand:+ start:1427 stop:1828 length:402 start_codon:yes stop_codon:yes gene_type:complete
MSNLKTNDDVMAAIENLVDAFSRHDKEAYFSAFADDATFLFHNQDRLLTSKAEYELEWSRWETEDQFRVLDCESTKQNLQIIGDTAIFIHWVITTIQTGSGNETSHERETIVMNLNQDGRWLAVHEHLSFSSL